MSYNFNIKKLVGISPLLFFLLFVSCSDSKIDDPYADKIGLETDQEGVLLSGNFISGTTSIGFESKALDGEAYSVVINLGDHQLNAMIDYGIEQIEIDGHGAMLTEVEKSQLLSLAGDLFAYVDQKSGEVTLLEYSLIRIASYWSQSPVGYTYNQVSYINRGTPTIDAARLGDEGITCIEKGSTVTAEYDDSRGQHAEDIVVGSDGGGDYDCMGRCGADCGGWLPSSWTKDCMDHDRCSLVNGSSEGSNDSNCGDEYDEAVDDWLLGVLWGCWG